MMLLRQNLAKYERLWCLKANVDHKKRCLCGEEGGSNVN